MKAVLASHNPGKLKEMQLWLEPLGIEYRTKRTGKSRLIKFLRRDGDDANDAGIAI